ncbi:TetR/AcrR family transcriptional regulator [Streptomyces sp. NBC_01465]|uniref:TetR/AcrR family transcriptional regulator n=1 Tax=Streptomyces sp. NBC_01465 TaxID=2903878 RepID=UPI002E3822F1|nr:helix-turn-helix domain-containing protein [Streptomyces sp. NBC_01465]
MAEAMGLRERKKRQTAMRIWRTALDLFIERGFDKVSVAEIAEAAEVSKMTVFNYFGTKEDLVMGPMEEHGDDPARAVRDREPGESAVDAVRRQFLEMVASRDPSVGLHHEPRMSQIRQLLDTTPVLMQRGYVFMMRSTELLEQALKADGGDAMTAEIAAAQLIAARNALIGENHRRMLAGDPPDTVAADAVAVANRAFDMIEDGLGAYGTRLS